MNGEWRNAQYFSIICKERKKIKKKTCGFCLTTKEIHVMYNCFLFRAFHIY